MTGYFDRKGHPISFEKWCRNFKEPYRRVAKDNVDDKCMVSTVWLGLDHQWDLGEKPLIFETMSFVDGEEAGYWRYSTEAEARDGHARVVAELKKARSEPGVGLKLEEEKHEDCDCMSCRPWTS